MRSAGFSAVALTDHNTVDGCARFLSAAEGKPIDAVCGAELTADYEGTELHLLGLFLAPEVFDDVSEYVVERNIAKESANKKMIERLAADGFDISYGEFVKRFPNRNRNRANIGALQAKGYVASVSKLLQNISARDRNIMFMRRDLIFSDNRQDSRMGRSRRLGASALSCRPRAGKRNSHRRKGARNRRRRGVLFDLFG